MIWGKVLACELLVPIQAEAGLLLPIVNGIAIENAGVILIHVVSPSFFLILLGPLTSLHYRERTAAQFIISTALVVVILFALALPFNPLNLLTRFAGALPAPNSGSCSELREVTSSFSDTEP